MKLDVSGLLEDLAIRIKHVREQRDHQMSRVRAEYQRIEQFADLDPEWRRDDEAMTASLKAREFQARLEVLKDVHGMIHRHLGRQMETTTETQKGA